MTKRNNKKTPEPMFVGTEPEETGSTLVNPEFTTKVLEGFSQMNLEDFPVTSGQMEEMGSVTWIEESGPVPEVSLHMMEDPDSIPFKSPHTYTFMDTSSATIKSRANSIYKATGYMDFKKLDEKEQGSYNESDFREPKPETDDGTRPEPPAGEKEYKHPFDPINDLHYQLNNAIQPLVDSMQKIIRDPYKAKESMSEQQFNYMVKEYGYLHSFLELSHKLIKERLRERDSKRG